MPDNRPQPPSHPWSSPSGSSPGEPAPLLLCGARLTDGRTVDVRLGGGRIEAVGTAGSLAPDATRACVPRLDLTGYLLLPAPAEPHAHADTALSADEPGPVSDDPQDVQRRATEAALLQLGHGATALRAHVRVGDMAGLGALKAVLRAARSLRGLAELTTVAMPRVLTGAAGADGLAVLRDAVKMGASVVGGCPDLDPDPAGYVEAVLEVASEHGCPVDLHTDAADPARLARFAAMAGGLRPGVTLGPCGALSDLPADLAARTADRLAAAGVTVVCLPQGGCGAAEIRGAAPVRLLRSAGVRVAAGSGALRDVSNPVGRGTRWRRRTCWPPARACPRGRVRGREHGGAGGHGPAGGARGGGFPGRPAGGPRRRPPCHAVPGVQPCRGARRPGGRPDERGTRVLRLGGLRHGAGAAPAGAGAGVAVVGAGRDGGGAAHVGRTRDGVRDRLGGGIDRCGAAGLSTRACR